MATRADDLPSDGRLVVIGDDSTESFDDWLMLVAADGPKDVDADAAELIRELREHGER